MNPKTAALVGFLFALPFVVVNFVVSLRIEPLYSFWGEFPAVRNSTFVPMFLLVLFPIGALIALRPMLKTPKSKRKFYLVNTVLAATMLIIFLVLFFALGKDMYRCDVLKIPNCD